jgi:hypothetical protein
MIKRILEQFRSVTGMHTNFADLVNEIDTAMIAEAI